MCHLHGPTVKAPHLCQVGLPKMLIPDCTLSCNLQPSNVGCSSELLNSEVDKIEALGNDEMKFVHRSCSEEATSRFTVGLFVFESHEV